VTSETAARALLDAFAAHDGETRDAASNALMVVDASSTRSRIAEAGAAGDPVDAGGARRAVGAPREESDAMK
jgi:hypothetical protein